MYLPIIVILKLVLTNINLKTKTLFCMFHFSTRLAFNNFNDCLGFYERLFMYSNCGLMEKYQIIRYFEASL
jgi:hypothetical protein